MGLEEVPYRVRNYFLTPCEKWSLGRRPFKLVTQLIKIVIITAQIYRFGSITQDTVEFQNDVQTAVWDIINERQIQFITTRRQYYEEIFNVRKGLFTIKHSSLANVTDISQIELKLHNLHENSEVYKLLDYAENEQFSEIIPTTEGNITLNLDAHEIAILKFSMTITHCDHFSLDRFTIQNYQIDYKIKIDNSDRSGLATYEFDQFLYSSDERIFRADFSLIFDFLTLIFTFISLSLVTRSLYRAQKLRYNFQKWHLQKFGKDSSAADASEFIDGWYLIIFISDLAVIIGTILKVDAQTKAYAGLDAFQNSCAFLGIGCLLCYCGILRYLGYFQGYNILVLTISSAMPNVLKFLSCALTLYTGYVLCGWLVLGPFNDKFRTLTVTSETLFSLLNGDDMFNTFQMLEPRGPFVFSQIYLYSFICVFIYVVLSLFISVVMDSYETIKANNGKRFHSAGIKLALEEVAGTQPLYENSSSCLPSCNLCCFLFKRSRRPSTSSTDQSLLDQTDIMDLDRGHNRLDGAQAQGSNSSESF